jgi:serine phosphatase RsbU (regulator of sigma subunit)
MLPANESIEKVLGKNNFFVLNKPRDIVSGDFYWFANLENIVIIAVADCTGHGVPGALMSMIGMNLLDEIVNTKKIIQPDKILNQMHKGINYALKQDETSVKDGMDMVVIALIKAQKDIPTASCDKMNKFNALQYAGAMNPLLYMANNELIEIKANKNPIGGHQSENEKRIFTLHEVNITAPTVIYLFTDGYQDQFGGKERKKFMVRKFKELLLNIHKKELNHQKQVLDSTIENWKYEGKEEQVDDILVMGISLL